MNAEKKSLDQLRAKTEEVRQQHADALDAVHAHAVDLSRCVTEDNAEDVIAQIMRCTSAYRSLSQGTFDEEKTLEYAHVGKFGGNGAFEELVQNFSRAGWSVTETNLVVNFCKRNAGDEE